MRYFLASIIICTSQFTFSQETGFLKGFIVTNENDTLTGWVKNKHTLASAVLQDVRFRPTEKAKTEIYTPYQLRGFEAGKNRYVTIGYRESNGKMKKSFMEILTDGYLSFYQLEVNGVGGMRVARVLKKSDEEGFFSIIGEQDMSYIPSGGKDFKKRIVEYLADEPAICAKVNEGTLGRKNIVELVRQYNMLKYREGILAATTSRSQLGFINSSYKHIKGYFLTLVME